MDGGTTRARGSRPSCLDLVGALPRTSSSVAPSSRPLAKEGSLHRGFVGQSIFVTDQHKGGKMSKQEQASVLAVARKAALDAGAVMRLAVAANANKVRKTKANAQDLVTEVDENCEKLVRATIAATFAGHGVLGEEGSSADEETSWRDQLAALEKDHEWVWVVDPIDGTTNFVHAIPLSVVSIGVAYKGEVVVAVVYDPWGDELFSGCKADGKAYLHRNASRSTFASKFGGGGGGSGGGGGGGSEGVAAAAAAAQASASTSTQLEVRGDTTLAAAVLGYGVINGSAKHVVPTMRALAEIGSRSRVRLARGGVLAVTPAGDTAENSSNFILHSLPRRHPPPLPQGLRDLGSAAIHLAWVAAGRLSAFFQLDLKPWDMAAGTLLVELAGGVNVVPGTVVSAKDGGLAYTLRDSHVLAGCSLALLAETDACLREARATEVGGGMA